LDKWNQIHHRNTGAGAAVASAAIPAPSNDIIQQLRTGVISVWKNDFQYNEKPRFHHFIIKISGVWENEEGCGLTYKFI
jgi:hypothetical protein